MAQEFGLCKQVPFRSVKSIQTLSYLRNPAGRELRTDSLPEDNANNLQKCVNIWQSHCYFQPLTGILSPQTTSDAVLPRLYRQLLVSLAHLRSPLRTLLLRRKMYHCCICCFEDLPVVLQPILTEDEVGRIVFTLIL